MMEYAGQTLGASAQRLGDQPVERPLESLASAVQRINTATVTVQAFISRFHGAEQPADGAEAGKIEALPPYNVTIERLFSALQRLENRIDALATIG
jgi:hypothetical protein